MTVAIRPGITGDCNGNGIPDQCDLSGGTSVDLNTNALPDECELSCDLDSDGDADDDDFSVFLDAYGRSPGEPEYNATCDFDCDGVVTIVDYQTWLQCYRKTVGDPAAPPPTGSLGDTDADGDVDLLDFAEYQRCSDGPPHRAFPCLIRFDFSRDGKVDVNDVTGFADVLSGP